MAKTATALNKFYVSLSGHRLQGIVEGDTRHETRPMRLHFRPRGHDGRPGDEWLTEEETKVRVEREGLKGIPENWPRMSRPLVSGVEGKLFEGYVFEANSDADAEFAYVKRFGVIRNRSVLDFDTAKVAKSAPVGLANRKELGLKPRKKRRQ